MVAPADPEPTAALLARLEPLVRRLAAKYARRMRVSAVDPLDLYQEGMLAAHRAAGRYDAAAGTPEQFFGRRVRGAMIDYLRTRHHWFPQRVLMRERARGGTTPVVFGEGARVNGQRVPLADLCRAAAPDVTDPPAEELVAAVRRAGGELQPGDGEILRLRYVEGLAWNEIGPRVGLTDSGACWRDCQLRSRLRSAMTARGESTFN